jgi:hypothetical protein
MNLIAAPALPLHSAGKYVAAAYIVFLAMILIYVAIMVWRMGRTERDLQSLHRELAERDAAQQAEQSQQDPDRAPEPV